MSARPPSPTRQIHLPYLLLALLLIALSLWRIASAYTGLQIVHPPAGDLPLTVIRLAEGDPASRPLVLVAHGFAGSEVLMRGFSLSLARAGYTVAAWDFIGHGSHPHPLEVDALLQDAHRAWQVVAQQQLGDPTRFAILGHSMGSSVALDFGMAQPSTAAVIAISPVQRSVTPYSPANLLLMAGALEAPFQENARQVLQSAGGAGGDPSNGSARQLLVVPGVEHISILFSSQAHRAARDWLDGVFGVQSPTPTLPDRRMLWYALGLLGFILLGISLAPLTASSAVSLSAAPHPARRLLALTASALLATLFFWLLGRIGLPLRELLGLMVGGFLLLWFLVAGLLGFLFLRLPLPRPTRADWLAGLLIFSLLWLGIGLLGQSVWLHWLLISRRLLLWPLGAACLLPWLYLFGSSLPGSRWTAQVGWWLAHSLLLLLTLYLAAQWLPGLGFLLLILPVFPLVLGLHALLAGFQRRAWAYALSGALFTSWVILAVFPLAG